MGCSPHQQLTERKHIMRILNLTQHPATPEQVAAGVVDLTPAQRVFVSQWLTFEDVPTQRQIKSRAALLAQAAANDSVGVGEVGQFDAAMIGGAPYLMGPLEEALCQQGIKPLYAFSRRESVETIAADGSVTKTNVFRHAGFVGD
jgi:hypothetical protein